MYVAIAQKMIKNCSPKNTVWCQNVIPFLAPYGAKTGSVLALYGAKNGITFWHHMVPHGASWCQKVPKRDTHHHSSQLSDR